MESENNSVIANCPDHGDYKAKKTKIGSATFTERCPLCIKKEKEKDKARERNSRLNSFRMTVVSSGIPKSLQGAKLSSYKPTCEGGDSAIKKVTSYLKNYKPITKIPRSSDRWFETIKGNEGLFFLGSNGTGKTHIACCIAQELLFAGHIEKFRYITAYDLVADIKSTWGKNDNRTEKEVIDEYVRYDFLIIDEIGVQFGSETENLMFFNIYNKRIIKEKPTLLITNLNIDEFKDRVGERILDRIRLSVYILFQWESFRKKKM